MSPEDRESVTRSIANLWTWQALFISRLLGTLEAEGSLSPKAIERLLQDLDALSDQTMDGVDDQLYAAGLLATVRKLLAQRRDGPALGGAAHR